MYWFEFEIEQAFDFPPGIGIGCGVTAINYEDALMLLNQKVFIHGKMPPIKKFIESIEIKTLDQGHVIPNMKSPNSRGIWFPQLAQGVP